MFREYDKDKSGVVKEDLKKVFTRLANDECYLGKVPNLDEDQVNIKKHLHKTYRLKKYAKTGPLTPKAKSPGSKSKKSSTTNSPGS